MDRLPLGKLPPEILSRALGSGRPRDPRVLVGPAVGEDAAAIAMGDTLLVAKSDPITFTADRPAWYSVHVNANDVACMGAEPRWFLATILLPEGCEAGAVEPLFEDLRAALQEVGAELVGGHTEVTSGLDRPLIAGTMLGEAPRGQLVDNSRITDDDDLILVKGVAIEATSIIARERAEELTEAFSEDWIRRAQGFLTRPGISVLEPARRVIETCHPHGMHDPTEGGLVGAIRELCHRAQVGVRLFADHVHVYPETEALCAEYGLDPFGLLASGALLVAVPPEETDPVLEGVRDLDVEAFVIGRFQPAAEGLVLEEGGEKSPLPEFEADEITRLFE